MKISKQVYVDDNIPYAKWLIWKLRKNKKIKQVYCICMVFEKKHFLEIINSNQLSKQHKNSMIIGITTTKKKAIQLTARIFDEIYRPNPNLEDMKSYFLNK